MKKLQAIVVVLLCLGAVSSETRAAEKPHRFEKEIAAFETREKTNPPPRHAILFLGSSSIRKWTSLSRDFPHHTVINHGFGGSEINDSVYYFDRVVLPCKPRMIVFYAGSNDINAGKKPATVVNDFKNFMEKVETELPGTKVDFISIAASPSRWKEYKKVEQANTAIAAMAEKDPNLTFIDTLHPLLDKNGGPRPELYTRDRLHMNAKGYAIWTKVIAPYLGPGEN